VTVGSADDVRIPYPERTMRHFPRLFVLCAILLSRPTFAQGAPNEPKIDRRVQDSTNVSVRLADGSVVYGVLERNDADSVIVMGAGGRMAFANSRVRLVRPAGEAHQRPDGGTEYWYPNSNTTRLFFAPTGRTLGRKEGYFAVHELILGSVAVGITDRVTIGGGSFIIPNSNFWFVTPKVGVVRGEKVNVSVGMLLGGVGDETGGIGFVAGTYGGEDNNVTVAVGNAFAGTKLANSQVLMVGGERRVSRRVSLVTENYVLPGLAKPLVSYGMRILGEKISVDLAFINYAGQMVFPGLPYVDFTVRF
jgi:hypothetical protein